MEEEKKEGKLLQWHAAFYAGIQIELKDEAEYLEFENEHMLSSKPMQLDVLIIKKDKGHQIEKNIGRIFRTYNIVEYKSPDDYLSIDDFFKVYGYTCFYKSDTGRVNEIEAEELTISFVCNRYPRELLKFLEKEQHRSVKEVESGIYYISDSQFAIQLIVQKQLTEVGNLWLKSLTNDLKEKKKADELLLAYKKHEKNTLYQSVMNIVVNANKERFQVNDMCEALEEIMEYHSERKLEEKILDLIEKKLAKGKSLAQIADELEETEEAILPLYTKAKEELGMA